MSDESVSPIPLPRGEPNLRGAVQELVQQLVEHDANGRVDFRVTTESTDETVVELHGLINHLLKSTHRSIHDARTKTLFLAKTNTDLKREAEERGRTEHKLMRSETRIRAIVDTAAEGIVTFTSEGEIDSFNRAAQRIFTCSSEEAVGRSFRFLLANPDGVEGVEALASQADWDGRRAGGSVFPMSLAISSVALGGETFYTALIRDLSEERRFQAKLAQAQKLESIGQLAAGIAHEINTPTQYVSDNIRFLGESFNEIVEMLAALQSTFTAETQAELIGGLKGLRDMLEDSDAEFLLEEIPMALDQSAKGLASIAGIVRAMKDFSHPGRQTKSRVDISKAIQNTVMVARNEWKYVATIETDFEPNLPAVPCYESEFNQVVLNIVVNAAHALEGADHGESDQGVIRLAARSDGDFVEVRISDNGCGIPEEVLGRIFDPFFTTKDIGKGTGQGLSIARSVIVEKHGGTIGVESEQGVGTTFILRLPLEDDRDDD